MTQGDDLALEGIHAALKRGDGEVTVTNKTNGKTFKAVARLSDYEREVILAGGLLPFTKLKA